MDEGASLHYLLSDLRSQDAGVRMHTIRQLRDVYDSSPDHETVEQARGVLREIIRASSSTEAREAAFTLRALGGTDAVFILHTRFEHALDDPADSYAAISFARVLADLGDIKPSLIILQRAANGNSEHLPSAFQLLRSIKAAPCPEIEALLRRFILEINNQVRSIEFKPSAWSDSVTIAFEYMCQWRIDALNNDVHLLYVSAAEKIRSWDDNLAVPRSLLLWLNDIAARSAAISAAAGEKECMDAVARYLLFTHMEIQEEHVDVEELALRYRTGVRKVVDIGGPVRMIALDGFCRLVGRKFQNEVDACEWWRQSRGRLQYDARSKQYVEPRGR